MKKTNRPIFVANWKMNLTRETSESLSLDIKKRCKFSPNVEVVVCPSHINIPLVFELFRRTPVKIGAQDSSWLDSGSLTGEVSPVNLKAYGVRYVILGHSERRQNLGETEQMINAKLKAVLKNHLIPIVCVGETFVERQEGRKDQVVARQVAAALAGVRFDRRQELMIAYEPVWVIGSGQAVEPAEAIHTAKVIQQVIQDHFHGSDRPLEEFIKILYGGSVDSKNVNNFIVDPISGVLVGGASLQVEEFCKILEKLD